MAWEEFSHSLGQTRKSSDAIATSALPPTADILRPVVTSEKCHHRTCAPMELIREGLCRPSAAPLVATGYLLSFSNKEDGRS